MPKPSKPRAGVERGDGWLGAKLFDRMNRIYRMGCSAILYILLILSKKFLSALLAVFMRGG